MRAFNKSNHVKNLPDTYRKDKESNNYKILEVERDAGTDLNEILSQVYGILDLDNAAGKTLDLHGEKIGQERGSATDEQYRIMIRAKAARSLVNGSYPSICNALCVTFGLNKSDICFDDAHNMCCIEFSKFPVEKINEAGFTEQQAMAIIRSLLPICVTLESISFGGTFTFADAENEMNENEGFTDVEGGTIGGTLGTVYGADEENVLPI